MTAASFDPAKITADWGFPNRMLVGPGRLAELPNLCRELGITRPLAVTDAVLRTLPVVESTLSALRDDGLRVDLFAEVQGNPLEANVDAGIAAYRAGGHDGVVAIGGGSALDVAKAVALMVGQHRPIWDFEDVGDNWKRANADAIAPVIAIPTTAGTGSEVGRASVITNQSTHRKVIVFHPRMLPQAVILDPEVTVGLPAPITAATGMDAFVHCFEAWCAPGFHPMADGIALQGMRLIAAALPRAYADGGDLEARTHMLAAASMGALAFQKGLGAVHAIAHPVGALYGTHHGLTNAVILPYVMRFNRDAIAGRMEPVAQALGIAGGSFETVLDWVLRFRERLGIPHTLADLEVDADRAEEIGRLAATDPPAASNPVPVGADDLRQVFIEAVKGRL
jgi:alcohol dehydrogenase class IV